MQDNLSLYHIFYTVARTGSISHSSRELYISQPAISKAIQKLEQNLDTLLFKRSSRGVTLTPDGELLFEKVKEALFLLDEGENSIRHNRSRDIPKLRLGASSTLTRYVLLSHLENYIAHFPHVRITISCQSTYQTLQLLDEGESLLSGDNLLKGQLRIAASDTICRYFLIDYLQKFHQTYPDVRIKVTNSTSIGCAELLEKGQADLIVCNCPNSRLGSHFQTRVLKEFHDVFVANTDYFPVHTVQTELQELLNYPILMLSPKSTTSEYLREAFTAHNLKLLPEVELNSNDLLLDLARIGLGIACVPDYMLKENDQLTPLMLKEPLPGRQLILAQHDSLTVSQAAERFIEMFTSI